MNIYKIWRTDQYDYDQYDSAIVIAENEEDARGMNPGYKDNVRYYDRMKFIDMDEEELMEFNYKTDIYHHFNPILYWDYWTDSIDNVNVEVIGYTDSTDKGVVLGSFHNG